VRDAPPPRYVAKRAYRSAVRLALRRSVSMALSYP